jgi:LuxR family maltose regulon positive regulatory protein
MKMPASHAEAIRPSEPRRPPRPDQRRSQVLFGVAETKIQPPVLRPSLVSRTANVNQLRAATSTSVVAVTAPGGYGKTTMLAQWAGRDSRPFAWISIDERDRDPIVLLRHVAAAMHAVEQLDEYVIEALAKPGESIWTRALPRLGSALSAFGPLVVVLDDAHLLRSGDSWEAVMALADHLPDGSLLVVAGRYLRKLPIGALRATGRLLELGPEELALTPREGQALLRSAGVELSLESATTLLSECEGWPMALALAALALRENGADLQGGAPRFRGAFRYGEVSAYIRSEYLTRLRPETRRFLRRTAILDQMCGGLCDAVLDDEGSALELEKIEGSNLFLVPLDRQRSWYRFHRLFRDVLRHELADREPKLVPVLHRRAADWYESHGNPESALEHARLGGDMRRVARIVTTIALPMYHSGRVVTVEGWLEKLEDPALLKRYPAVALQGSWIHALRGRSEQAERWLRFAELGLHDGKRFRGTTAQRAWITVIRAALCKDGVYQMIADAESGLAGIGRDNLVRPAALAVLGAGYMLLGQRGRANAILAEAAAEAERLGATETQVLATSERSIIAAAQDDAPAAERLAHEAHELMEEGRLEKYETTAITLAASARAALRNGHWDEARADLDKGRHLAPSPQRGLPWLTAQTRIELARVYLALRETRAVQSLLAEIRELLTERPYVGVLVEETEALEREVAEIGAAGVGLTPAELRLLPFLCTHLSFGEIGEKLYVSRNTIKTQAISVYRKLGVTSRSDAIDCAARLGLVDVTSRAA